MSNRRQWPSGRALVEQAHDKTKCGGVIGGFLRFERLIGDLSATYSGPDAGECANSVDLAAHAFFERGPALEQREFDGRRSGVEGEDEAAGHRALETEVMSVPDQPGMVGHMRVFGVTVAII